MECIEAGRCNGTCSTPRHVPRTSQGQHIEASTRSSMRHRFQQSFFPLLAPRVSRYEILASRVSRESNISCLLETCWRTSSFFRVSRILYTLRLVFFADLCLSFSHLSCNVIFTRNSLRANYNRAIMNSNIYFNRFSDYFIVAFVTRELFIEKYTRVNCVLTRNLVQTWSSRFHVHLARVCKLRCVIYATSDNNYGTTLVRLRISCTYLLSWRYFCKTTGCVQIVVL